MRVPVVLDGLVEGLEAEAVSLFTDLGMDMSSAVNIFLRQCILRGGLPFPVEIPEYN
ncbi:MAG: type II toxin-antitoxin system RelB/DinJ family antitoxin, partial [Atopobiaceae bacterium]|nr:type II toxin-antitoxin system RelB/DinJ family antitoxin [Atopobiaceae bacterium]